MNTNFHFHFNHKPKIHRPEKKNCERCFGLMNKLDTVCPHCDGKSESEILALRQEYQSSVQGRDEAFETVVKYFIPALLVLAVFVFLQQIH